VLEGELLRLVVLGEPLADLGDPLAGPGPARRGGLLLVAVEEGDGLDVEVDRVVGLPPELLGDDGAVGEAPARAVALVDLLQPGGGLVELHAGPRGDELDHGLRRRWGRRPPGARLLRRLRLQRQGPRARAVDAAAGGAPAGDGTRRRLRVLALRRHLRLPVLEAERALEAAAARHGRAGGRRPQRRGAAIPARAARLRGEQVVPLCAEQPQSHIPAGFSVQRRWCRSSCTRIRGMAMISLGNC